MNGQHNARPRGGTPALSAAWVPLWLCLGLPAGAAPVARGGTILVEEASGSPEPPPPPAGEEKRFIGEYVAAHTDDVRDCYARRLLERPTLQGRLLVRFDIGPSGRVIGATAEGLGDSQLVLCVVAAVRRWEFERPRSGGKLRILFPFRLAPEAAK
jgi:outer membrane biosynthesis protein TonB